MNTVLEHLAQDSDSYEDDESGSELSDNYQSDNDELQVGRLNFLY